MNLIAINGKALCVERREFPGLPWGSVIARTDADKAASWEDIVEEPQPQYGPDIVALRVHDRYFSAQPDGSLVCDRALHRSSDPRIPDEKKTAIGPWELFVKHRENGHVRFQSRQFHTYICADLGRPIQSELEGWSGCLVTCDRAEAKGYETFTVAGASAPASARRVLEPGITVSDRVWMNGGKPCRPFGGSLFWLLHGLRSDEARALQSLDWLAERGTQFVRFLSDVSWPAFGIEIDSSRGDHEELLRAALDALSKRGLAAEITVWGGSRRDPIRAAAKVTNAVLTNTRSRRRCAIVDLEGGNESFQNGPPDDRLAEMVRILNGTGCLTAWSSPVGDVAPLKTMVARGAKIGTIHPDRGRGRRGERCVRQAHDFEHLRFGLNVNEPIGPRSSVAELTDPGKLAMLRAMCIFYGAGAWVLHNGNGVFGKPVPQHNRAGDLWTVPNIDEIMRTTSTVDRRLPDGVERWRKTTQHGGWGMASFADVGGQPLAADTIWSDGDRGHGVDRCYGAVNGGAFVTMLSHVLDYVDLRAARDCEIEIENVAAAAGTAATVVRVGPQQPFRVTQRGHGTDIVIRGRFL